MLPHRGVVGGELLAMPDERAEERVVVGEQLEANALGAFSIVMPVSPTDATPDASISSIVAPARRRRDRRRRCSVRVEAGEVGEAPVLVRLRRQRNRLVALEQLRPSHVRCPPSGRTAGAASARSLRGPGRRPYDRRRYRSVSPSNSTPSSSSLARAAATSGTRSAIAERVAWNSPPIAVGSIR